MGGYETGNFSFVNTCSVLQKKDINFKRNGCFMLTQFYAADCVLVVLLNN